MQVYANNFYSIFAAACAPNKLVKIHNIETGNPSEFVIHGEFVTGKGRGHCFEIPCSPELYKNLVIAMADSATARDKQQKASERKAKEAKDFNEVSEKGANGSGEARAREQRMDEPHHISPSSQKPASSGFTPPTKTCADRPQSKRLTGVELALFKKFENLQPMKNTKRRTQEERDQLEIARSYLLCGQTQVVLDWIKYFEKK